MELKFPNKSAQQSHCSCTRPMHRSPFRQPTAIAYSDMFQHVPRPWHWLHRLYIYKVETKPRIVRCRRCHIIHPRMVKVPHWSIKGEQTLYIIFQEFFPVTTVNRLYMTWQPNFYVSSRENKEYGRSFYVPKKNIIITLQKKKFKSKCGPWIV